MSWFLQVPHISQPPGRVESSTEALTVTRVLWGEQVASLLAECFHRGRLVCPPVFGEAPQVSSHVQGHWGPFPGPCPGGVPCPGLGSMGDGAATLSESVTIQGSWVRCLVQQIIAGQATEMASQQQVYCKVTMTDSPERRAPRGSFGLFFLWSLEPPPPRLLPCRRAPHCWSLVPACVCFSVPGGPCAGARRVCLIGSRLCPQALLSPRKSTPLGHPPVLLTGHLALAASAFTSPPGSARERCRAPSQATLLLPHAPCDGGCCLRSVMV